jgi:hypothetical protein
MPEGAQRAERQFLEALVRIHRAEEGVGFDGIKPTGTQLPPQVVAADAVLETRSIAPLRGLIPGRPLGRTRTPLRQRVGQEGLHVNDLPAAHDYVAASSASSSTPKV